MPQPAKGSTRPEQPVNEEKQAALVERVRAGDAAAFTMLYERYYVPICRYLARVVGNDEVGNDLAQETFLAAWRALPDREEQTYVVPWLYRVASNLANSHLRRARLIRWLPWGAHEGGQPAGIPSLAGPEEQTGETERITLALAAVSPKYRACLLLQLDVGFSQREIGRLLGLREQSVSVYISRGRQQFRQAYHRLEHEPVIQAKGGTTR